MRPVSQRTMRVGIVTAALGGLVLVPAVESVAATPHAPASTVTVRKQTSLCKPSPAKPKRVRVVRYYETFDGLNVVHVKVLSNGKTITWKTKGKVIPNPTPDDPIVTPAADDDTPDNTAPGDDTVTEPNTAPGDAAVTDSNAAPDDNAAPDANPPSAAGADGGAPIGGS
jgi:hypothetical protein